MIAVLGGVSRGKGKRRLIGIAASGLIITLLHQWGWLAPIEGLLSWAGRPFAMMLTQAGKRVANISDTVTNLAGLSSDNAKLRQENSELRQQLAEDAELRQQNLALRRQLQFNEAQPRQLIPVEVIGYQPDSFRQFLTVGRGSQDGVREGMAVISEGSLVGKISEVGLASSKVFLVTDPNFRVNGLDQESRATGTVRGQIGSGFVMDKIAQNETVKPGDTIVTSGMGGELPKGLIIGRVESVNQRENAVFQTAYVVSDLRFSRLELVFVVK